MILADWQILKRQRREQMIEPFVDHMVSTGENGWAIFSYGLGSHGYDIRIGSEFVVMKRPSDLSLVDEPIDPKKPLADWMFETRTTTDWIVIPANGVAYGKSVEYFRLPRDLPVLVIGKSSYARAGVNVYITPGEAGWHGRWTIEIANQNPYPVRVYANEGIAQVVFFASEEAHISYADRKGKYQGQNQGAGVTLARFDPPVETFEDVLESLQQTWDRSEHANGKATKS